MQVIEHYNLLQRTMRWLPITPRRAFLLSSILGLTLLTVCLSGCGGPPAREDTQGPSASGKIPELNDELIRDRINFTYVRNVPEETGSGEPIGWSFAQNEPKEITVVERQMEGEKATIVLDIKTRSAPRARSQRELAGQIRTEWQLRTGWVLRQWEIVDTENISMKYKNLEKPPGQNSNGNILPNVNIAPQR